MRPIKQADRTGLGIAIGAIVAGLFILFDSLGIKLGSGYDHIGPRFFPYVIATGLVLTGVMMLVEVLCGSRAQAMEETAGLKSFFMLLLALIGCLLLLEPAGFIVAAAAQFWLVARAFNSMRPWRDAVVAIVLSIMVYLVFTRGLGLVLPRGLFAGLF